jgi:hypothetical protein
MKSQNLTPAEVRAYAALARAAKRLREAQRAAEAARLRPGAGINLSATETRTRKESPRAS